MAMPLSLLKPEVAKVTFLLQVEELTKSRNLNQEIY